MATAAALLILRLVLGLTMAGHGAQKLFGWWGGPGMKVWIAGMTRMRVRPPVAWAWMSALAEVLGGLAVAVGLLSPLGNLGVAASMLVAVALVHRAKGFWVSKGGYEYNLLIVATVTALAITGPGSYSLDSILGIHLPEPLTLVVGTIAVLAGVGVALGTRSPAVAEAKPQSG
jgi:putative oxidoreductase